MRTVPLKPSSGFSISRAAAMGRKELMHILRDPFTMALAIALPMILVVFFGFAIDFDFKGIKIAVFDGDKTFDSRSFSLVVQLLRKLPGRFSGRWRQQILTREVVGRLYQADTTPGESAVYGPRKRVVFGGCNA